MRPQLLFRKIHKWAGLILGVQLLLWFVSGLLMSWMPIGEIHGDHLLQTRESASPTIDLERLEQLQSKISSPILAIKAKSWLNQDVLEVKTQQGTQLFDANTLTLLTPLEESQVIAIIKEQLLAKYTIDKIKLLDQVPMEARGRKAPVWQVKLQGDENPVIYISPETGEIIAKRTDRWRLFDFLWMLHIMDYDEREDFNHPLLYLTALSALLFTLTGFLLLYYSFRKNKRNTPAQPKT